MIAAVLVGGDDVLDRITIDDADCHHLRHREILSAMRRLRARGEPAADPQLIEVELGNRFEACGGHAALGDLVSNTSFSVDTIEHYARLVREASVTRNVVATLAEIQSSDLSGYDMLSTLLERVSSLSQSIDDPAVTMGEAVKETFRDLHERVQLKEKTGHATWGIRTGFSSIDTAIAGLQLGVVTIIAARPSMGKSALARSIAYGAHLVNDDCGAHIFSCEDSRRAYALRQVSDSSGVSLTKLRDLTFSTKDLSDIARAADELAPIDKWIIDDTNGISADDVAMRVRKHKRRINTKVVVVDYAQLLRDKTVSAGDKQAQVEVGAEKLLSLARSENIAVVLLSQLNRDCEKRDDKRPMLADLRASGALEQIAETVIMLYRDDYYHDDSEEPNTVEAIVRKNKNGVAPVTCKLHWDGKTATMRERSTIRRSEAPPQQDWTSSYD